MTTTAVAEIDETTGITVPYTEPFKEVFLKNIVVDTETPVYGYIGGKAKLPCFYKIATTHKHLQPLIHWYKVIGNEKENVLKKTYVDSKFGKYR